MDIWIAGLERARRKARVYGTGQAHLVAARGEQLPLADNCVDLVVSNNGFNNVADPIAALHECSRVCRRGAQLVLTMNLPETMALFYDAFASALTELGLTDRLAALERHIYTKRKPLDETEAMLRDAGFAVERVVRDQFRWSFLDSRALFEHFDIRFGFLEAWRNVVAAADWPSVSQALRLRLDRVSAAAGAVHLDIPFVCLDCRKQ